MKNLEEIDREIKFLYKLQSFFGWCSIIGGVITLISIGALCYLQP